MKKYAAAWGIIIGWVIGALIGIPLNAVAQLSSIFSLVGLIIGYVLSQRRTTGDGPLGTEPKPSTSERLKHVEKLRSDSLITEEEYRAKRNQILDDV